MRSSSVVVGLLLSAAPLLAQQAVPPAPPANEAIPSLSAVVRDHQRGSIAFPLAANVAGRVNVRLGDLRVLRLAPTETVELPLVVDPTGAGGADVASFTTSIAWDATKLTLDSVTTGGTGSLTPNLAESANGSAQLTWFSPTGSTAAVTVARLFFTAGADVGGTTVVLAPSALGDEGANSLLANAFVRQSQACVAPPGLWGDVNGDGPANIIDAQQIARASVALSVARPELVVSQGDVNADATVDILDAQQIARSAVGLSAAARIGTSAFVLPAFSSVVVTPATAVMAIGEHRMFTASPRTSGDVAYDGCAAVTWATSAPAAATVDSIGIVNGIADGDASVTATIEGVEGASQVSVGGGAGTGLRLNIASPVGASRYYAYVTGDGLSPAIVDRLDAGYARNTVMDVPLPAGTYRVRVIAADSLSANPDSLPIAAAGASFADVVVVDGARTTIEATLLPMGLSGSLTDSLAAGDALVASVTLTDPSGLFYDIASFSNLYNSFTEPTADRSVGVVQVRNPQFIDAVTVQYSGEPLRPTTVGTLYSQFGNGVSINGGEVIFWLFSPSIQRGEPLNQTEVTAATSGVRVNISSTAGGVSRYLVAVDTGGGASAWGELTGTELTGGSVDVPVPAGAGYRVRVAAVIDYGFSPAVNGLNGGLLAGNVAHDVAVTAGAFTDVAVELVARETSVAFPTSAQTGEAIPFNGTMRDPSLLSEASACLLRVSFDGPISNEALGTFYPSACTNGAREPDGTYSVTGSIPAQVESDTTLTWFVFTSTLLTLPTGDRYEIVNAQEGTLELTAAATTGLRLNVTSPIGASRYWAYITGSALAEAQLIKQPAAYARNFDWIIPLPAGTDYFVRLLAADSLAASPDVAPLLAAGAATENVVVTEGVVSDLPMTLELTAMDATVPTTGTAGYSLPVTVTMTDPSRTLGSIANWVIGYSSWDPITADRSTGSALVENVEVLSPTQRRFSTEFAPARAGTLRSQFGAGVTINGATTFWIIGPSLQRGEAPLETEVAAGTSGIRVNVTSPMAVNRYVAVVDTGAGPTIVVDLRGEAMTSGQIELPVPPGIGFRVRVAAADSIFNLNPSRALALLRAGTVLDSVDVAPGAYTEVGAAVVANSKSITVTADTTVGAELVVSGSYFDPSRMTTEDGFCAIRYNDVGQIPDFGLGTITYNCSVSNFQPDGSYDYVGTIPGRTEAGTRWWLVLHNVSWLLPDGSTIELDNSVQGSSNFTLP